MTRQELYEKLKAPFPAEAYTPDRSRGFALTSLKAQYVVERLNEVFGIGRWGLTGEWRETDDGVLYFGELYYTIKEEDGTLVTYTLDEVPGFAGLDRANSGDAYKSARTDCLSKSASYLGVGNEMYKGLIAVPGDREDEEEDDDQEETEKPKSRKRFSKGKAASKFKSRKLQKSEDEEEEGYVDAGEADEEEEEEVKPKTVTKLKSHKFSRKSSFKKKGD